MNIETVASGFGLTLEHAETDAGGEIRVLKGVNQVFAGSADEVQGFLSSYQEERPGLLDMSMYGYRE